MSDMILEKTPYYEATNVELAWIFNTVKTANTPFFTDDIDPFNVADTPCLIRIYVTLSTQAVLSLTRTRETTTVTEKLNGGAPLTAGCAYIFDSAASDNELINLTADADTTILKLSTFWVV
jgi:hypothetical protein